MLFETAGIESHVCAAILDPETLHQKSSNGKELGAGMGGSWAGDNNDCWDYCFGKEQSVVTQLDTIVRDQNFDGVDVDYEYFVNLPAV